MLRHSSATYWAPKMNRYQFCAKYGWAFSSDMPDRYIKRKGIIFDEIAEKGDQDQMHQMKKENLELKDKINSLDYEYKKIRRALEYMMPKIEQKPETLQESKIPFIVPKKGEISLKKEDSDAIYM